MSFNLSFQKACNRAGRMAQFAGDQVRSLLQPFSLLKLYPITDYQKEDGTWGRRHEILPHQKKIHAGIAPSGQRAKFVCISGGVGCLGGKETISGVPLGDLAHQGVVDTMFGPNQSSDVYRKGQAELWRVTLRSGRSTVVTEDHRFLTLSGWRRLADLGAGDLIASDGNESDRNCWGTPKGYQRRCFPYSRPCGEEPSPEEVSCQLEIGKFYGLGTDHLCKEHLFPSIGGSSRQAVTILRGDGVEYRDDSCGDGLLRRLRHTFSQSGLWTLLPDTERLFHLSVVSEEDCSLFLYICRTFSDTLTRALEKCSTEPLSLDCPATGDKFQQLFQGLLSELFALSPDLFRRVLESLKCLTEKFREQQQPASVSRVLSGRQELLRWLDRLNSCSSSDYNSSIFWDEIASINYDSFGDFFDLTVPDGRHYSSGGIIHSNSGKTLAMCCQCLYFLKTYPGIKIVVATAFDYFFVEFLLPTWRRVLDDDDPFIASKNVKDRHYVMINGSEIRFHAYIDPDNIRGWEAHVIWIDEGAQIGHGNNDVGYALWTAFTQRLRAKPDGYPRMMYVSQNPSGHNWVWKVFIKPEIAAPQPLGDVGIITEWGTDPNGHKLKFHEWEKVTADGDVYYTIVTSSYANKHLASGYIASMLGTMADQKGERERMIEGMWTPINALVYEAPLYSTHTHCVDYRRFLDYHEWDEIPSWNRVVAGIDCGGQRSPWAVEYYMYVECEYTTPHWVCFDEIYHICESWDEIADMILEKQKEYGFTSIEYFIDPQSSNHQVGPTQTTVKREFAARGIATRIPPGYNKPSGISRVHTMLKRDRTVPCPYLDDEQVEEEGNVIWTCGHSKLYYLQNCPGKPKEVFRDGKKLIVNAEGYAAPGNIHEKGVYRYDNTKMRAPKQTEEGLTPALSQKLIDRDDHAQTSEMFFALGIAPMIKRERSRRQNLEERNEANGMYGRSGKYRRG